MASQNSFQTRAAPPGGDRHLPDLQPSGARKGRFRRVLAAAVLAQDPAREPAATRRWTFRRPRRHTDAGAVGCRRRKRSRRSRSCPRGCCCRTSPASRPSSIWPRCVTASSRLGGDPKRVNPLQPVELVIDHSVQVDYFAERNAFELNAQLEFSRNKERYSFLRWGQTAFDNFRVVPPDTGHRAPGEPRIPGARGVQRAGRRAAARVSRHAGRYGLAHHHGQRSRRRRLGRGRHRGRGGHARSADLHADSGGRRLPPDEPPAGRRHGHGPRADDHRATAQGWSRREVRRVLRARPRVPDHRRSRDAGEHVARVWRDDRDLPDRRDDARLSAAVGPRRIARPAGRSVREGAGAVPDVLLFRSDLHRRR